jgi:hypothetical protein
MEKKNDSTILLLVAAGLGIYWLLKKQSVPPATTKAAVVPTSMPMTAPVLSMDQTLISEQPIYGKTFTTPVDQTVVSTQPVYDIPVYQSPVIEVPIYSAPIDQTIVSTQPVYDQPVQSAVNVDYTPVTDMFNSISTGGGLQNNAYENIVPIDNINLSPKSALSDEYL